jgi:hypothetical protein
VLAAAQKGSGVMVRESDLALRCELEEERDPSYSLRI